MWSTADIPDQTGRVAVVTGANGGLGLATAEALAGRGAHVVMAARDEAKAAAAVEQVRRRHPDASVEVVPLDLGSLASVEAAAERILAAHPRIHVLVNNAGLMAMPERETADGFEMQLGVNHLGHWALTARLLPAIVAAPGARVVSVASTAMHIGRPIDSANPHLRDGAYAPWKAYGQSKLANRHFAMGLQRAFDDAGVDARSLVAHPGLTHSDLQARTVRENPRDIGGRISHLLTRTSGMSTARGALSQLRAATDPDLPGGALVSPLYVNSGPPVRKPLLRPGADAAIRTLWAVSERETGLPMDVAGAAAAARA
jgi:NAD(P)-dependent dehydrogenase (short-subunit alcohol dehydrogenase family)